MTLTPATLRLDLKCGQGAISPDEKCHKGPATQANGATPSSASQRRALSKIGGPSDFPTKRVIALAASGALTAAGLYQIKNMRQAYAHKFDPAQRYTPFKGTIGDPEAVLKSMTTSNKTGAPSLFGEVRFGTYKGQEIVAKKLGEKGLAGSLQIDLMQAQGIISPKTADALKRAQGALQVNEVQAADLAGKLGFGPKLVAAGNNTLVTKVAQGRPLMRQDRLLRHAPKLQKELAEDPVKGIRKLVALQWRGFTKGTEISPINKAKVLENMGRMHTAGISHNDLHPGNIFISSKGAQFIDYGTSERGGGSVAAEFVRMMNPPRFGLQQQGGMGYNLRTVDPAGYAATEKRLRQSIGKRTGKLTAADIHKAVEKSVNKQMLETNLQSIIDDFYSQHSRRPRTDAMALTPATLRLDSPGRACGQSFIAAGKTCRQKGAFPTGKAIAAGLGITALGVGAYALSRRRSPSSGSIPTGSIPTPSGPPLLPGAGPHPSQPRLPGLTPRALLAPAPARKSKTQRMRENTAAAMKNAEGRIAQTAREEVRRIGQIGNTMAAAGEATGMAAKTTMRELRLRTEAARRKYEPGYRRPDQRRLPGGVQAQLPQQSTAPQREPVPIDPRTGQPRRRRARGFGRTDSPWAVGFDAEDGKKYTKVVTNPETGRKNRIRYGAKGYKIAPGTDKGDRYCARSFGDMKSHGKDCSGADRNTPLCLSRAKWKCSGESSRRDGAPLTPPRSISVAAHHKVRSARSILSAKPPLLPFPACYTPPDSHKAPLQPAFV